MISQTIEYAVRAMSHLASQDAGLTTSEAIAAATRVPHGYLSKIMSDLVRADLVRSHRGPHGGFALAREPDRISVLDIVNAVDPIRRIDACPLGNPEHTGLCPLHRCLDNALGDVERTLGAASLAGLLQSPRRADACAFLFPDAPRTESA